MPLIAGKIVNLAVGVTSLKDGDHEGGWRRLDDTTARDAIPVEARKRGMVVYTNVDGKTWQLITPAVTSPPQAELGNNTYWTEVISGGGGGVAPDDILESATLMCPSGVAIGDVVSIAGSGIANKTVSAVTGQTEEAFGIVRSKPTATTCVIVPFGEVNAFGGLVVGDVYFSDPAVAGGITNVAPSGTGVRSQVVGIASTLTVLFVTIRPSVEL